MAWTGPPLPWLATCTCGVWQTGFLCQQKGPRGRTGGQWNSTPSFSPVQSQDVFLPSSTAGNNIRRVELEDSLLEGKRNMRQYNSWALKIAGLSSSSWAPDQEKKTSLVSYSSQARGSPRPLPDLLGDVRPIPEGLITSESWVCLLIWFCIDRTLCLTAEKYLQPVLLHVNSTTNKMNEQLGYSW